MVLPRTDSAAGSAPGANDDDAACLQAATGMMAHLYRSLAIPSELLGPTVVAAQPGDVAAAINAFHRMQALFRGFSSEPPGDRLSLVVALLHQEDDWPDKESETLSIPSSPDQKLTSLQRLFTVRGLSTELLLSPAAYREARALPGLSFAEMAAPLQSGRPAASTARWFRLCPAAWFVASAAKPGAAPHVAEQFPPLPPRPASTPVPFSSRVLAEKLLPLLFGISPKLILGLAAAMVLLVSGVIVHALSTRTGPKEAPSSAILPAPSPAPLAPATQGPVPAPQPAPPAPKAPPPRTSKTDHRLPAEELPAQTAAKDLPPPKSGGLGIRYTTSELATLVGKADRLTGDGKYDEAIRLYRIVLREDPRNADALRGLHRAQQNRLQ